MSPENRLIISCKLLILAEDSKPNPMHDESLTKHTTRSLISRIGGAAAGIGAGLGAAALGGGPGAISTGLMAGGMAGGIGSSIGFNKLHDKIFKKPTQPNVQHNPPPLVNSDKKESSMWGKYGGMAGSLGAGIVGGRRYGGAVSGYLGIPEPLGSIAAGAASSLAGTLGGTAAGLIAHRLSKKMPKHPKPKQHPTSHSPHATHHKKH